ncbi:MAG: DapH/DapD/GlmU-related protein [Clostridia bacterium]
MQDNIYIDKSAKIGKNVKIFPNNHILGDCELGDNCVIYPNSILTNAIVGAGATVTSSVINDSVIGANCTVGPFAYVRPHCVVGDGCRIGDFVEIKNATIGDGSKLSHLTYAGDCAIGKNCNIGCGVVFVNYNGVEKNHTTVGDRCFVGSNCNVVAPINIADGSFIAAGTTITKDVDADSFVVGRAPIIERKNFASKLLEKFRARKAEKENNQSEEK